jgi:hypothetical protein
MFEDSFIRAASRRAFPASAGGQRFAMPDKGPTCERPPAAGYFGPETGQVLMPSRLYTGHMPTAPVSSGTTPM